MTAPTTPDASSPRGSAPEVDSSGARLQVRDLTIEYSSSGYTVRPIDNFQLDASAGDLVLLLGASG